MRKGGGKSKGAHFERVTAKAIVKAFRPFGIKQTDCWRSVMSGGHKLMSSGDLQMTPRMAELFPYSVECKHRKKIKFEHFLLDSRKSEEMKWIAQVLEGASRRKGIEPVLVLKGNNQDTIVLRRISVVSDATVMDIDGNRWQAMSWSNFMRCAIKEAERRGHEKVARRRSTHGKAKKIRRRAA